MNSRSLILMKASVVLPALVDGEGLLVAELAQERDFAIEVADAKGDVRDADDALIWRGRLRDQSCRAGACRDAR